MAVLDDITLENLKQKGIEGFSFTMPVMSHKWCDVAGTTITGLNFDSAALTLNAGINNWLAPISGILQPVNSGTKKINISLQKADGSMVNENGVLIRLFPQQILRLKRLYTNLFEDADTHNAQFAAGLPIRQVPAYLFIAVTGDTSAATGGLIHAKDDTGFSGDLSFLMSMGTLFIRCLSRLYSKYCWRNMPF